MLYPASTPKENNAFGWFKQLGKKYDIEVEIDFFENLSLPLSSLPDIVVMRGYDDILSQSFEQQGIRVVNSTLSMSLSRNKMETQRIMEQVGVRVPKTLYFGEQDIEMNVETLFADLVLELGVPFIAKELSGSKGENVFLVRSFAELREVLYSVKDVPALDKLLFQEFIESSCGRDVRAWVVDGEVVASVLRYNKNSFKSNFAQGGEAFPYELPESGKEMAIKASAALGLDFAGVDLLFGGNAEDEFVLCEVNGNAGFRTAAFVYGENNPVPESLIRFLAKNC